MASYQKIRLAIFATHPIQYQVPLWRKLAAMPDFEVHVFFGTDMSVRGYQDKDFGVELSWDTPLLEGYESTFLSVDPRVEQIRLSSPNAKGLKKHLKVFKPDIGLMTAYANAFHFGVWRCLRQLDVPIVMRHEASDVAHARSGMKARVRDLLLRQFYTRIDAFAYIGTEAKKHLTRLGVPEHKLQHAPYCVDSDFVQQQKSKWLPERDALRTELGIKPEDAVLVFSGKLIPKKDPLLIVRALECLQQDSSGCDQESLARIHVVIAGDGELRARLQEGLKAILGERAHMMGFLNQSEMAKAYAVGDALILPSKRGSGETWGLVVNEGLQWGLPAIVSNGVGSSADLIIEGETGWSFDSGDAEELARCIRTYVKMDPEKRDTMKRTAESIADRYSIVRAAEGVASACRNLLAS